MVMCADLHVGQSSVGQSSVVSVSVGKSNAGLISARNAGLRGVDQSSVGAVRSEGGNTCRVMESSRPRRTVWLDGHVRRPA